MSTLDQMIANCRSEVIEPTPGFWSDAEFTNWLNDAYFELAKAGKIEQTTPTIVSTVIGTEFYAMPSDFYAIKYVEREITPNQNDWQPLYLNTIDNKRQYNDLPFFYYIWNNQLGLTPIPDQVLRIRTWYYRLPTTMTVAARLTDTPIIPQEWHSTIEKYAVAMALRKAQDQAFQVYLDQYNGALLAFKRDANYHHEGDRFQVVIDDWDTS